jgi:predicted MFS family arabinose efflux permease
MLACRPAEVSGNRRTGRVQYGEMGRSTETTKDIERATLLTRPLILLTLTAFAALFGFQLLLPVVPLYASGAGGGSSGAGLATSVFMLSTVLSQMQMPRILNHFSYRKVLAVGLLLLGLPAFFYGPLPAVTPILAVTLVRGIGFGIATVVFATLIVELAPPGRRGEALGLLGVAITLPTIFCSALGLWLVERFGYEAVFLLGGMVPALGLGAVLGIPTTALSRQEGPGGNAGFFAGLRRGPLLRIFLLFLATTMAAGVIFTFLPLAAPGSGPFSAMSALLMVGVASATSRWWAGRFSDRRDPRLLLTPGLLAAALGMIALGFGGTILIGGALLFGTGFGLLQNATLILTMKRVSEAEYGLGSTLWNVAFDAGTGLGAFLFGFVITATGFSWALDVCAGMVAAALVLVALDHNAPVKS